MYGKIIEVPTGIETYVLAEECVVDGEPDEPAIIVNMAGGEMTTLYRAEQEEGETRFVSACGRWRFVGQEEPFKERTGDGVEISALRPVPSLREASAAPGKPLATVIAEAIVGSGR